MPIIALSAWKNSGKDTVANYLIEKNKAIRIAFADVLKDLVAEQFNIDRSSLDDPKRKEAPLLHMPVDPKDAYSKMIAGFLVKEFRNKDGLQPDRHYWSDHGFTGVFNNIGFDGKKSLMTLYDVVYWTPRALAILLGSTMRSARSDFWVSKAMGIMEAELKEDPTRLIVVSDLRYKSEMAQLSENFGDEVVFVRIERFKESPSADPSELDLNDVKFEYYVNNIGTLEEMYSQVEQILKSF